MAVIFNQTVRHGRHIFVPGAPVAFTDGVEDYFVAAGWASVTSDSPVFTYEDVEIDPLTRFAENGRYVQPSLAEAHLEEHGDDLPPTPQERNFQAGLIAPETGNG